MVVNEVTKVWFCFSTCQFAVAFLVKWNVDPLGTIGIVLPTLRLPTLPNINYSFCPPNRSFFGCSTLAVFNFLQEVSAANPILDASVWICTSACGSNKASIVYSINTPFSFKKAFFCPLPTLELFVLLCWFRQLCGGSRKTSTITRNFCQFCNLNIWLSCTEICALTTLESILDFVSLQSLSSIVLLGINMSFTPSTPGSLTNQRY